MAPISNRAKNIRVRNYFIKDIISAGYIVVNHCTTREMLAEYFTKPLQGALLQNFRAGIQGIPTKIKDKEMFWYTSGPFNMAPEATNMSMREPRPQECVGKDQTYDIFHGFQSNHGRQKRTRK